MAIDDVLISPGTCPQRGSCNFEVDSCGYINVNSLGDEVRMI